MELAILVGILAISYLGYTLLNWKKRQTNKSNLSPEGVRLVKIMEQGRKQRALQHQEFLKAVAQYKETKAPEIYAAHIKPRLDKAALDGHCYIDVWLRDAPEEGDLIFETGKRHIVFQALLEYVVKLGLQAREDESFQFARSKNSVLRIELPKADSG